MDPKITAALIGAIVALFINFILERYRAGEGYRKIVYEKVVEAIAAVHDVYNKLRKSYFSDMHPDAPPDRRSLAELLKKHTEMLNVLNEHSLYYPRDLRRSVSNAATYYCISYRSRLLKYKEGEEVYSWEKGEELHRKYLKMASSKIDFKGVELLNLGYTGKETEEILLPFDPLDDIY